MQRLKQDADTKQVTIKKIYSGTPSEEAGLKEGDEIISVGDTDATSEELSDLVKEIRGDEGTTVHLKVYRASTDETFEVDVERKNVELPSVEGQMLDNGVAYMQISEFQTNTAQQFGDMLDGFENAGMKGLIVDLRGNPGRTCDGCYRYRRQGSFRRRRLEIFQKELWYTQKTNQDTQKLMDRMMENR